MPAVTEIPQTYDEAVAMLARWHGQGGEADLEIFAFPDPRREQVRLVLVSDGFQQTGIVRPLPLGSSTEFPFHSAVALVTHEEWRAAQVGRLPLPQGWDLAAKRQVWP